MASESVENYLKAIFELEEEHGRAATSALAERLSIASPSVSEMIKRLSREEPALVDHQPHHGVVLTDEGRARALKVIRSHRLLETFLVRILGFTWDEVHEEAERLEHHISERMEDRIAERLGHPQFDPHGSPIPTKDGRLPASHDISLTELELGRPARVVRIHHDQKDLLRYLTTLGIEPSRVVEVVSRSPFDGPVRILVGEGADRVEQVIGPGVADMVYVAKSDGNL